jgi:nucleoside phosphorylase
MLAILAPMATELAGIRRSLDTAECVQVSLHVLGVGRQATLGGTDRVARARPDAILMVGFCGAAAPDLKTGDVHVAGAYQCVDARCARSPDSGVFSALCASARDACDHVDSRPSLTVDEVADAGTKAAAWREHGAASVNMEDFHAAQVAAEHRIPFASVRVVLDAAHEELPEYVTGAGGNPMSAAVRALIRPQRIGQLTRLARQASIARRKLTYCVREVVMALPSSRPQHQAARHD